jgi:hypothetical protein
MTGMIFEYRGKTWRTLFLNTDSRLSWEDRERLTTQIFDMYLDKKRSMKVRGDSYEGKATANGYHLLGQFGGRQFDVLLETNHGKSRLCYLVGEIVDSELN